MQLPVPKEDYTDPPTNHDEETTVDVEDGVAVCTCDGEFEEPISTTNGSFFSYFLVVVCFFSWLTGAVHLTTYLRGMRWGRNPAEYLLELKDPPAESTANQRLLDAHALGGLTVVVILTFQVVFTFWFRRREAFRKMHRIVGRLLVVLWFVVSVLGMTYTLKGDRWNFALINRVYLISVFWILGFGTLANLAVGVWAICSKAKAKRYAKDYLVHKGCMSFSMYWILFSAFNENLTSIVQVIIRDCPIGTLGVLTCQLVGLLAQSAVLFVAMAKFDPPLLKQPFVRWNLGFQMFYCALLLVGVIGAGMYPDEGTCLNPY